MNEHCYLAFTANDAQDLCEAVDELQDADTARRCVSVLERLVGGLALDKSLGIIVTLAQSPSPTARRVAIIDQNDVGPPPGHRAAVFA